MQMRVPLVAFCALIFSGCVDNSQSRTGYNTYTPAPYVDPLLQIRERNIREAAEAATAARQAIREKRIRPYTIAEAQEAIRRVMRNPEGVRFRLVRSNAATGAVCGVLNAQNAYGAYVGESPFIYYYSHRYSAPQALTGPNVAATATVPYIEAFCPK